MIIRDATNNATHVISQRDGAIVYVQKIDRKKFNIVIDGEEGIVSGMMNFSRSELEKLAKNNGWESLPF